MILWLQRHRGHNPILEISQLRGWRLQWKPCYLVKYQLCCNIYSCATRALCRQSWSLNEDNLYRKGRAQQRQELNRGEPILVTSHTTTICWTYSHRRHIFSLDPDLSGSRPLNLMGEGKSMSALVVLPLLPISGTQCGSKPNYSKSSLCIKPQSIG